MRGKKAKLLRKKAYGDLSIKSRHYQVTKHEKEIEVLDKDKKVIKKKVDKYSINCAGEKQTYKQLKKGV